MSKHGTQLNLEATLENLVAVNRFLDELLDTIGCSSREQMQLQLAVEELYVNIANYAYGDRTGMVAIYAEILESSRSILLKLVDEGICYNPLEHEMPDIHLPVEKRKIGNLGIFLAKTYVDEINYEYRDGKNILTLRKSFA